MIINKKQIALVLFALVAFSSVAALADYKTTLQAANQAIDNLDNLGTHAIDLNYRDGGLVILDGTVASDEARRRVEQAVRSVKTVKQVDNRLEVLPDKANAVMMPVMENRHMAPTDQEIGSAIKQALNGSDGFDISQVEYRVDNGRVVLTGKQANHKAIDKILSVVLMVDGVSDINSQMTVNGAAYPTTLKR